MNTEFYLSKKACTACDSLEFLQFYSAVKKVPLSNGQELVFQQKLECCNRCGLVRQEANSSYADGNLNKYYSLTFRTPIQPEALSKGDKRVKNAQKRLSFIHNLKRTGALLEVGFGDGVFLRLAASHFKCVGLDPSAGYKYIHDNLQQKGIKVSDKPLEKFPAEGKFDVVCSFLVLEHIKDPLRFVKLQIKQLKRNGILVIEVPDIRRYVYFNSESVLTYEHVYHYCIESLSFLLSQIGLELVSSSNRDVSYGFSMIAAFRLKKTVVHEPLINGFGVLRIMQGFIEQRERYRLQMGAGLKESIGRAKENGWKVALYGTGFLFNYALECCGLDITKVDLLLDDTRERAGTFILGKPIQPLREVESHKPEIIIVFSEMFFDVMRQNILSVLTYDKVEIINIHQRSIKKHD